jgi:hypothetical protein
VDHAGHSQQLVLSKVLTKSNLENFYLSLSKLWLIAILKTLVAMEVSKNTLSHILRNITPILKQTIPTREETKLANTTPQKLLMLKLHHTEL